MIEEGTTGAETAALEREKRKPTSRSRAARAVRLISVHGKAALVEYAEGGEPLRVTIPLDQVRADQTVAAEALEAGLPYGIPWERVETAKITPASIASALRKAGIWTWDDLRTKQMTAVGALQAAYGVDLGKLNRFATEFAKEAQA